MARGDVNADPVVPGEDVFYEAPAVFDFGPVFEVTRGSGSGNQDDEGQEFK
jgi:hypothetical protein